MMNYIDAVKESEQLSAEARQDGGIVRGLDPGLYSDGDTWTRERTAIFEQAWIFVAMSDDLARANDFVTKTIGRRRIVVQRMKGELRAFANVCAHRLGTIQRQARGNGPLVCRFHGWAYDHRGVPSIPGNQEHFGLDDEARAALALEAFAVDVCGRFVFVRISQEGPSLPDFLGPAAAALEALSEVCAERLAEDSLPWGANWKLGVESVLEIYHTASLHPDSFAQMVTGRHDDTSFNDHSLSVAELSPATKRWWQQVRRRLHRGQCAGFDEYRHFLIFPNLAIGVTDGSLMSVQTYEPEEPARCRLAFQLWLAAGDEPPPSPAVRRAVIASLRDFNAQVLDEDRTMAEMIQSNLDSTERAAILGANESRIAAFHAAYRRFLV